MTEPNNPANAERPSSLQLGSYVHVTSPTHHRPDGLVRAKITRLGYKFLTVKTDRTLRYDLETLQEVDPLIPEHRLGRLYFNPADYRASEDGKRMLEANKERILDEFPARLAMMSLEQTEAILAVFDDIRDQA